MATLNLSLATKTARANSILSGLGASALIRLYTGTIPASPDAGATGTLLSTLTGNAGGFGSVVASGVTVIAITAGGTGYTGVPAVAITGGSGTGASAVATVSGGVVNSITVTNAGSGFLTAPTVTLSGGAGTGATATAAIGVDMQASAITQDNSAAGTGTPGYARLLSAAGVAVLDVDVSGAGAGGAFQIVPSTLTAGAPVTCSSFLIAEG